MHFISFSLILNQRNFSFLIFSHWLYVTAAFASCLEYAPLIASAVMPLWLTANFTENIAEQLVTLGHMNAYRRKSGEEEKPSSFPA